MVNKIALSSAINWLVGLYILYQKNLAEKH
ncbi:hypothetical protein IEK_05646 [Bacillus toyonensis]|nr:hypothetical protein IEK_05646 [Bacillus toyonensis]